HHDMLAVLDRLGRETDAGAGIAGRLDDHLDGGMSDQAIGIINDDRRTLLERCVDRGRGILLFRPAAELELGAGPRRVQVRDADEMHAVGLAHLRQEHQAEFPGPDQTDGDRFAGGLAFQQHAMEIHVGFPGVPCATVVAAVFSLSTLGSGESEGNSDYLRRRFRRAKLSVLSRSCQLSRSFLSQSRKVRVLRCRRWPWGQTIHCVVSATSGGFFTGQTSRPSRNSRQAKSSLSSTMPMPSTAASIAI